ncbi:MAG: proteasome-activating nucleotidase [Euryarchaeota archaeon]|nr:proteasome-activating nucleotidase [Euryarchaeota archaeon]
MKGDTGVETPQVPAGVSLEDRLRHLEESNLFLVEEKRRAQTESRFYKDELESLKRETRRLLAELEKARTPPLIVGIVEDLLQDDRVVVKASTGPNFVVPVAESVVRKDLVPGARVSLTQNNLTIVGILPPSKDPHVMAAEVVERPRTRYSDVGGLSETIEELREAVEYPLTRPQMFTDLGIEPPRGVLLIGPPGTGKTLLAKAVAGETNATFIRVVASELVQKFIGEGARKVHELFVLAREKAPSIIFIDELDAIGARRTDESTASNREVERTLMQLLAEMDGFDPRGEIRLLAATNRPDILDPALTRPGRFDRTIDVKKPTLPGVEEILKIHMQKMRTSGDVLLPTLAKELQMATGADIKAICTEAGMAAVRRGAREVASIDFAAALGKYIRKELPTQKAPAVMYS